MSKERGWFSTTEPFKLVRARATEAEKIVPPLANTSKLKLKTDKQLKCIPVFTYEVAVGNVLDTKTAIAHCVSADLAMGKGLAAAFKRKFGKLEVLNVSKPQIGEMLVQWDPEDRRYLYSLVTKEKASDKPTYQNLEKCLKTLRDHIKAESVSQLSIPQLGCGLDKLQWDRVEPMLKQALGDLDLDLTVYILKPPVQPNFQYGEVCDQNR